MEKYDSFLNFCKNLKFNRIELNQKEIILNNYLNDSIFYLCKSLPQSVQTEASMFLMYYLNMNSNESIKICGGMYYPVWSLIYHIATSTLSKRDLTEDEYLVAIRAQSMAFFLHHFDDNLNDNDIESTHLNLLIRSQAHIIQLTSINELKNKFLISSDIEKKYFNDYSQAMLKQNLFNSYDEYCNNFINEIATWYIVPTIVSKLVFDDNYRDNIITLFSAYGIAVRLIDDINDIEKDLKNNIRSAVYYFLNPELQKIWLSNSTENMEIIDYFKENNVINDIIDEVNNQLDIAANYAKKLGMDYLNNQFKNYTKTIIKYHE